MERIVLFALGICALLLSSVSYADGMRDDPEETRWSLVLGAAGGIAITTNLAKSQTFPVQNAVTDEYFIYKSTSSSQNRSMFEGFAGFETEYYSRWSKWILQLGVAYTQASPFTGAGYLTQGADPQSQDMYFYRYNVKTHQLMAQGKFMFPHEDMFYPYFLIGLGASFNNAGNYLTNVPPFLTFTREYTNRLSSSFAWRLGLGMDVDVFTNTRIGIAYRFANLGQVKLGPSTIDGIPVYGTLKQSNLLASEIVAQLTYTFNNC